MPSIFKRSRKSPPQLVNATLEDLNGDFKSPDEATQAKGSESLAKRIGQMKLVLYGEPGKDPVPERCDELSTALQETGLMKQLIAHLRVLQFDVRQDVGHVWDYLVAKDVAGFASTYVSRDVSMMFDLLHAYESSELSIVCGSMFRSCLKNERLHRGCLYATVDGEETVCPEFVKLCNVYVQKPNFEVSGDAFASLRAVLTEHPDLVQGWMAKFYNQFVALFHLLLQSEDYLVRRQGLRLLGELLLLPVNRDTMMRYIKDRHNLKLIMSMLSDSRDAIRIEAFHVFKVFVANPARPEDVTELLAKNASKILTFLRSEEALPVTDEAFVEEKALLIHTLTKLEPPAAAPITEGGGGGGGGDA